MAEYTKADRLKALDDLADYDHCFIAPEGVHNICRPFGFEGHTITQQCDYKHPKGLQGANGEKELTGADAADVAKDICRHLGVEFPSMFGRGSQLRVCIEAARQAVQQEQT